MTAQPKQPVRMTLELASIDLDLPIKEVYSDTHLFV
jgi:hypothetical protein